MKEKITYICQYATPKSKCWLDMRCHYQSDNREDVIQHEKICKFNPELKCCYTCKHQKKYIAIDQYKTYCNVDKKDEQYRQNCSN